MANVVKKHSISTELAQKCWPKRWLKLESLVLART